MLPFQSIGDLPANSIDASDVAIVVAHPDDETIGCGALLSRLKNVSVIFITDGAPRIGPYVRRAGFESHIAYGKARSQELRAALAIAGITDRQIFEFNFPDQEACRSLLSISRRLASFFKNKAIATVLTHAYEAGHPDHDGTAFCVHAAAALLHERAPMLIEMPFYHLGAQGMVTQTFCDGEDEIVVTLPPSQRQIKIDMMTAHATQTQVLRAFSPDVERYRVARNYDFRALPNDGRIFYSRYDCSFSAQEWGPLAHGTLQAIELEGAARP
jgi:LmbE family N-acetylglucosaminyl deacetylase